MNPEQRRKLAETIARTLPPPGLIPDVEKERGAEDRRSLGDMLTEIAIREGMKDDPDVETIQRESFEIFVKWVEEEIDKALAESATQQNGGMPSLFQQVERRKRYEDGVGPNPNPAPNPNPWADLGDW